MLYKQPIKLYTFLNWSQKCKTGHQAKCDTPDKEAKCDTPAKQSNIYTCLTG